MAAPRKSELEARLDTALAESFPASDPVALTEPAPDLPAPKEDEADDGQSDRS